MNDNLQLEDVAKQQPPQDSPLTLQEKIRHHLDEHGIRHAFLARRLGYTRTWTSKLLDGTINITPELKSKIEAILKTEL